MEKVYPFSCESMVYDYDSHRYFLTEKGVLNELNTDLSVVLRPRGANREAVVRMFLEEISDIVYDTIYSEVIQDDYVEYLLAKIPTARERIKQAMLKQVSYFLVNGDLSVLSGVNPAKGTFIKFDDKILAGNARKVLQRTLPETGRAILYKGRYSVLFNADYKQRGY